MRRMQEEVRTGVALRETEDRSRRRQYHQPRQPEERSNRGSHLKISSILKEVTCPTCLRGQLLSIHSSCVHDQEHKCPLLVSVRSLTWELNQAANIGNEEDNALKRHDPMCAARPLSLENILKGIALADSMNEEPK